uniref:Uncharacterized protein n=1 Tax=viral metagenome TaxID=1070528 RepID=A0A6C0ASM8_9ZZZZ
MFQTLFELGKTCALGFLLNEYIKRHYPDDYENFVVTASFKFFYFYSQTEIFIKQTTKYITEKYPTLILVIDDLKKFARCNQKNHCDIEFIKNSRVVKKVIKNQCLTLSDLANIDYDFLIYKDRSTLPNNIKIIRNLPNNKEDLKSLLENNAIYEYEKSNIKFILVEIIYQGKTYKLDLSNNKVNFYIKDNIFNYSFFLYYLRYYHEEYNILMLTMFNNIDIASLPIEITLKLIDQNVNSFYMDLNNDSDYLVIQKDDYIIEDKSNNKK